MLEGFERNWRGTGHIIFGIDARFVRIIWYNSTFSKLYFTACGLFIAKQHRTMGHLEKIQLSLLYFINFAGFCAIQLLLSLFLMGLTAH